jgi:hypothetical protein
VRLKDGVPLEPEKFRAAIEKLGDKVRTFEVELRGTVERQNGAFYLRPTGVAQRFAVSGGPLATKLVPLVGKRVRARGTVISSAGRLELQLSEVAPP